MTAALPHGCWWATSGLLARQSFCHLATCGANLTPVTSHTSGPPSPATPRPLFVEPHHRRTPGLLALPARHKSSVRHCVVRSARSWPQVPPRLSCRSSSAPLLPAIGVAPNPFRTELRRTSRYGDESARRTARTAVSRLLRDTLAHPRRDLDRTEGPSTATT